LADGRIVGLANHTVLIARDGAERAIDDSAAPIRDAAGRVTGAVLVFRDVTERREAERTLHDGLAARKLAAEELQEADRRKDEFLATLAHELRNPLAPVRNALEVMRQAGDDPVAVEQTRAIIERQVGQMVRLIDDLLDVSRITRNALELRAVRVDLAAVVQSAVEISRPLIEAGGHHLTLELPDRPIHLQADPTRLAQVFSNLLNNSAKYSEPNGRIVLAAERQGGEVVVAVRDTGVGIPAAMLPRIFDPFLQGDRSLERTQGGLGIGLTLVRRLVEMHGGSVVAQSAGAGQGSELIVRLPALPETADAAPDEPVLPAPAPAGPGLRILVVDDNRDSAESLGLFLGLTGHEVATAHDGLEAVAAAESFRPRVVLLDIGLPKLNGYEAARRIRAQEWGRDLVLMAVTGWGQEADRRRSADAGFDHHLVKPVDPAALNRLLAALEPAPGRPAGGAARDAAGTG
jgi:signal transduction histidine kinase/ActR/RegA family two-component response regulator